jgi:hypothetical protein
VTDRLIAEAGRENTVVLKAGDNFGWPDEVEEKKAELILDAFAMLGVDGIGLGDRELAFGIPVLERLATRAGVHLVCANLQDVPGRSRFLVPYLRLTRGRKRLVITSVIDPALRQGGGENVNLTDPVEALEVVRDTVRSDLFIVLCHADGNTARTWLNQVTGIDLAILGHCQGVGYEKEVIHGTVVVFNNDRGQHVGYVDIEAGAPDCAISGPQNVTLRVEEVARHGPLVHLIEEYEAWERTYHYEQSRLGTPAGGPLGAENRYVGTEHCTNCHQETVASWSQTAHAAALDSLVEMGKEYDPQCLPCHVTGMKDPAVPGGFVSVDRTLHLGGVQCEACHGPGGRHVEDPGRLFQRMPGEESCRQCHTEETDPDFAFQRKRDKGVHSSVFPASSPLPASRLR